MRLRPSGAIRRLATSLCRLERLERDFSAALEEAKLQAMYKLAAGAGHEINNAAGTAKLYTVADTIDLIANTATFDGKVRVFAVIAELGSGETAATFA